MRLGFLGGTFDPPHIGHLEAARLARDQLGLDRVYLVVAAEPAHKTGILASPEERVALVEALVAGEPGIEVEDIEMRLERPSWTFRTIRALRKKHGPEARLIWLIGTDHLDGLEAWKNLDRIRIEAEIVALPRSGHLKSADACGQGGIRVLKGTLPRISSSELRKMGS